MMQFQKLTLPVSLAIAAVVSMQPGTHASTKYNLIIQQFNSQSAQPQAPQPISQGQNVAVNQAGQTVFSHPAQLSRVTISQRGAGVPSTYEFTLTVPQGAGQPLQAVTITQFKSPETIKFDVSNSKAFLGKQFAAGPEIRLASMSRDQPAQLGEATIVFDQPVQPGSTVTVALEVERNPVLSGVYLFGVTAYPAGDKGIGQFLGYGRIHFYGNSN